MITARQRLTKLRCPLKRPPGTDLWWFIKDNELWILVGYGSKNLEDHDSLDQIIGYRVGRNGGSHSAIIQVRENNPVKYTRTACRNTKVLDEHIPFEPALGNPKKAKPINEYLNKYFVTHYQAAIAAMEDKGHQIQPPKSKVRKEPKFKVTKAECEKKQRKNRKRTALLGDKFADLANGDEMAEMRLLTDSECD